MKTSRIAVGFSLIVFAASLVFAQKVTTDFDHTANFSKYKTFMWIKQPESKDPLMKQRLIDAINAQLMAKGLQPVAGGADLGISANVATQEKHTLNTFYDGFGGWGWGMGGMTTTTVETYEEGTMVVDIFDGSTKKVVWRGTAMDEVPGKTDKKVKKVEKAVEKMFKNFPPKLT